MLSFSVSAGLDAEGKRPGNGPAGSCPPRAHARRVSIPIACSAAPSPMPDSISSLRRSDRAGREQHLPPRRPASPPCRRPCGRRRRCNACPSKVSRRTRAPVSTRRLARPQRRPAGTAAGRLQRRPWSLSGSARRPRTIRRCCRGCGRSRASRSIDEGLAADGGFRASAIWIGPSLPRSSDGSPCQVSTLEEGQQVVVAPAARAGCAQRS